MTESTDAAEPMENSEATDPILQAEKGEPTDRKEFLDAMLRTLLCEATLHLPQLTGIKSCWHTSSRVRHEIALSHLGKRVEDTGRVALKRPRSDVSLGPLRVIAGHGQFPFAIDSPSLLSMAKLKSPLKSEEPVNVRVAQGDRGLAWVRAHDGDLGAGDHELPDPNLEPPMNSLVTNSVASHHHMATVGTTWTCFVRELW